MHYFVTEYLFIGRGKNNLSHDNFVPEFQHFDIQSTCNRTDNDVKHSVETHQMNMHVLDTNPPTSVNPPALSSPSAIANLAAPRGQF